MKFAKTWVGQTILAGTLSVNSKLWLLDAYSRQGHPAQALIQPACRLWWPPAPHSGHLPIPSTEIMPFSLWERVLLGDCTCSGSGLSGNLEAQIRKMSGAGFPFFTSGSVLPQTMWWNKLNKLRWSWVFISIESCDDEVATAIGILCLWRCSTNSFAPEIE